MSPLINPSSSILQNHSFQFSKIAQLDGGDSLSHISQSDHSDNDSISSESSEVDTDEEIDPQTTPITLTPPPQHKKNRKIRKASSLPLVSVMNVRSLYNKPENFKTLVKELGLEASIISETWEREEMSLQALLGQNFKIHSYKREKSKAKKQPGGGCAIVYNENRFKGTKLDIFVPKGVEACWLMLKPNTHEYSIQNIAMAAIYVSPNSKFKTATINHVIDTIHLIRAQYDNRVNFIIGGDLNQLKIDRILDAYGPLRQLISFGTRKSAILEKIITDLHTLYQPPRCLAPLQVDDDKPGTDSDHNIAILAPILSANNEKHKKRSVKYRPLQQSGITKFTQFISNHTWQEVLGEENIDKKVANFHFLLRAKLDEYFPEKTMMVSYLDKKWMTPQLKNLNRKLKREFFKNRKSQKWKTLKGRFKKLKKRTIQAFYSNFVNELKESNPSKWYSMAKKLGTDQTNMDPRLKVESMKDLDDKEAAEEVAKHFSSISQEYSPLNTINLPAYLPAPEVLSVNETQIATRIQRLKCRKSTQPCDFPSKLRKLYPCELAIPVTDIINSCLTQYHYPRPWKHEWVVPAEKVPKPESLKDLRKISLTSEFSLIFEGVIKDWIMEDITKKIDPSQFGNQKGSSTEHLIVCLMDKLLQLLDNNNNKSAVIATLIDWSSAFDRQDPTLAIKKFLEMGVRPSLVPVLASYLTDREMQVRYNDSYSSTHSLPGGGPQGSLVGLIEYFVQSNDNADSVDQDKRFKFVDDLSILELLKLAGLVSEYNFKQQVASDIGIEELYVDSDNLKTQEHLNKIADWTDKNKMKLNENKTKYMVFSRSETEFSTRLCLNGKTLERIEEAKIVGVWVTTWLDWTKNTAEICKKAYARVTMLTKLKYAGVDAVELINIYILYIRSVLEYCCVVWHSTLTEDQRKAIERVQKTCLKVILGQEYQDYSQALNYCGLISLEERREQRCLRFALKCLTHPVHNRMFPVNPQIYKEIPTRNQEHFAVNMAKSESYRKSAIRYIQRKLNDYVEQQKQM